MSKVIGAIFLAAASFASAAYAHQDSQCDLEALQILALDGRAKELAPAIEAERIVATACKMWPYKPGLLLMAVAYDENVKYEKGLILAIQDRARKKIVNIYKRTIQEDALTEVNSGSFSFDTARYDLTPQVRAFGLIFNSSAQGASCADLYFGNQLSLFVPEKATLRRVLTINRTSQRWIQGCRASSDHAITDMAYLNLEIAQTTTNGLRDIQLLAYDSQPPPPKARSFDKHLLRYDGKTYIAEKNKPWWLSDAGSPF